MIKKKYFIIQRFCNNKYNRYVISLKKKNRNSFCIWFFPNKRTLENTNGLIMSHSFSQFSIYFM